MSFLLGGLLGKRDIFNYRLKLEVQYIGLYHIAGSFLHWQEKGYIRTQQDLTLDYFEDFKPNFKAG